MASMLTSVSVSEGVKTNAPPGLLLADTGPIRGVGGYTLHISFNIIVWTEDRGAVGKSSHVIAQLRNVADDDNIGEQLRVATTMGKSFILPYLTLIGEGQRIRVINGDMETGPNVDIQVAINGQVWVG